MKLDLNVQWVSPHKLIPYANNAKLHSKEQIIKIAGQIKEFGFDQPIVIDKKKVIIKGHGRREASIYLKLPKVPVITNPLPAHKARASRLGDNKVAEAPWDEKLLETELHYLKEQNYDLALTGFDQGEQTLLLGKWESDINLVHKETPHTKGITSVIKITCPQEIREDLKQFLTKHLDEGGFKNVEIS